VHFEITGTDPQRLRRYYGELFGWQFDTSGPVWDPGRRRRRSGFAGHAIFYVGVPDVEAALRKAESLGGTRRLGPARNPGTSLVIGHFTDPEGHLIGLAATG
jgi:uncharacterized protein